MDSGDGPIHSRLDDDPAHAEAVDRFVVGLAECVDALQDLELRGNWATLAEQAAGLGAAAESAGYPALHRAAEEAASAARQGNAELAYKALITLTELARRVRQGHRGAL